MYQSALVCTGTADAAAAGLPSERTRTLLHGGGGVEKQRQLFRDCGLCHQPDADGTVEKRIQEVFSQTDKELIFLNEKHRKDFYSLLIGKRGKILLCTSGYAAAVFLLSADEILWEKVYKNVQDTGIYFDRIKLGGVTLEQYILFHAAKDVYYGTKHIRLSELTDRELIPGEILRVIVNAFVIEKCGVDIVKQEVWDESPCSE